MAWYLGGIRVIVTNDDSTPDVKQSEHIVLDGDHTIYHHFGYGNDKRTIKFYLLDNPQYFPVITNWYKIGSSIILKDAWNNQLAYKIVALSSNKVQDISRPNPVYLINCTLSAIESGSY